MNIVFRCDASTQIGTGHVMRCLTLADALTENGHSCVFICKEHHGNLIEFIRQRGHRIHALAVDSEASSACTHGEAKLTHAHWLGSTQSVDAELSLQIIKRQQPDWLVVDHYGLDIEWEQRLQPHCKKLMVVDDLADRQHDCHMLLDQTFGRQPNDYYHLVPRNCKLLCGTHYALLRPEFSKWRDYSLARRKDYQLKRLLINLGGVDKNNITTAILRALTHSNLPIHCEIMVVMGTTSPWVNEVEKQATLMPWKTQVKGGVSNMAELMANSDLAIGAAGSTSWERCCLGLPTIMLILATNQEHIADNLEKAGAVYLLDNRRALKQQIQKCIAGIVASPEKLRDMSISSSSIVDGVGLNESIKSMK